MRTGMAVWSVSLVLGALFWLSSVGVLTHPACRLVLMIACLSWTGYLVWTPKPGRAA